jgi:hypothetical protein
MSQSGLLMLYRGTYSPVSSDPCLDPSISVLAGAVEGRRQAKCNSPKSSYRPGAVASPVWSRAARTAISGYRDAFQLAHNRLPDLAKSLRKRPTVHQVELDLLFKLCRRTRLVDPSGASRWPRIALLKRVPLLPNSAIRALTAAWECGRAQSDAAVRGKS